MTDIDLELRTARAYINKHQKCKDKKWEFNLTLAAMRRLMKATRCYYTGLLLDDQSFTIDRIDSTKGYVMGNIVACHTNFNSFKGSMESPLNVLTFSNTLKAMKKIEKIGLSK